MIKKILILYIAIFALQSCSPYFQRFLPNRPQYTFDEDLKDASLEFQQGWSDGCETGMSSGSNTFYKMFYRSNQVDGYKMANSSDYKTAWGNAFWYCYRYDHVKHKSSIWGSVFRGYQ